MGVLGSLRKPFWDIYYILYGLALWSPLIFRPVNVVLSILSFSEMGVPCQYLLFYFLAFSVENRDYNN